MTMTNESLSNISDLHTATIATMLNTSRLLANQVDRMEETIKELSERIAILELDAKQADGFFMLTDQEADELEAREADRFACEDTPNSKCERDYLPF